MDKRRILNIVCASCYLIIFIFSCVLCFALHAQINGARGGDGQADFTAALTGVVLIIVLFLAIIYACFALVPLMIKSLQIFFDKRWISILCIAFDTALTVIHVALLSNIFTDGAEFSLGLVMLFVCILLSLGAFALNILSLTPLFSQSRVNKEENCESNA